MHLIAKKLVLQAMAEKAGSVVAVSGKEVAPLLKNFYFDVSVEPVSRLRMVATDLDLSVIANTSLVQVLEPGIAIIPARKFLDIVKEASDTDVDITTNEINAMISTPSTRWSIQLMSGKEQYPLLPRTTDLSWKMLEASQFLRGLRKARLAVAKDDTRPELKLLRCDSTGVKATDGGRLHISKIPIPRDLELQVSAVDDLLKLLRIAADSKIGIADTETHILFDIGNDIFMATKLQVKFPDISLIVESAVGNNLELQVSREELITAIKRTRITADEETNRITLSIDNNELSVETRDKQNNSCIEKIACHWNKGKMSFSTNWVYLHEALTEMESPNVRLMFGADIGKRKPPILIEEESFTAVISQLRNIE